MFPTTHLLAYGECKCNKLDKSVLDRWSWLSGSVLIRCSHTHCTRPNYEKRIILEYLTQQLSYSFIAFFAIARSTHNNFDDCLLATHGIIHHQYQRRRCHCLSCYSHSSCSRSLSLAPIFDGYAIFVDAWMRLSPFPYNIHASGFIYYFIGYALWHNMMNVWHRISCSAHKHTHAQCTHRYHIAKIKNDGNVFFTSLLSFVFFSFSLFVFCFPIQISFFLMYNFLSVWRVFCILHVWHVFKYRNLTLAEHVFIMLTLGGDGFCKLKS